MHIGFWDMHTHTRDQAIVNENAEILRLGKFTPTSHVLDAGCGVGGTAVYIGDHTKSTQVTGVTLVSKQVHTATRLARIHKLSSRIQFVEADYTRLPFADGTFDVVYGIESICYAFPKSSFLYEAHRVLKKGGRLIIADGFLARPIKNSHEQSLHDAFCNAFVMPELIEKNMMERAILASGFTRVQFLDKSDQVVETTKQLHAIFKRLEPFLPFIRLIPFSFVQAIPKNAEAGRVSLPMLEKKLGCYGIFTAVR